ncbi:glycine betaine ABC transporter substrate-binding protein [Nocardioides convexus]|uniref:glycine betaine ABC transporter substrate-binding protein n=1 Tax=Nocardioides convexus TaxID=2712224 RepID=UPI0024183BCE|nr:glycine betaine ABC transporter substrate-binding protein [Nocardioides convexus]
MRHLRPRVLAATLAASLVLAGCGLRTAGGIVPDATLAGPLADAPSLDGVEIKVGSKNFSENIILGKIVLILFNAAGASVSDLTNIPGSASARQAQALRRHRRDVGVHRHRLAAVPRPADGDQGPAAPVRRRPRPRPEAQRPGVAATGADEQHLRLRDHPGQREEVRHHQVRRRSRRSRPPSAPSAWSRSSATATTAWRGC